MNVHEFSEMIDEILVISHSNVSETELYNKLTGILFNYIECNSIELLLCTHSDLLKQIIRSNAHEHVHIHIQVVSSSDKKDLFYEDNMNNGNVFSKANVLYIPLKHNNIYSGKLCISFPCNASEYASMYHVFQHIGSIFSTVLNNYDIHADLIERTKELGFLYELSQISHSENNIDTIFEAIVSRLPQSMKYPERASAVIQFRDQEFRCGTYDVSSNSISTDIIIDGKKQGTIKVVYSKNSADRSEYNFLLEEQNLLDSLTASISQIIKRKEAEDISDELHKQLLHSDRLATIGQLAAGVAHELNEPLAAILGFAQLARRTENTPQSVKRDIEKIIAASLHSREIVKKLVQFSRQTNVEKQMIQINETLQDALFLFHSRCAKNNIQLVCEFSENISLLYGNTSQIQQIFINLAVNAIQAMPEGGILRIRTVQQEDEIVFSVQDSGIGIPDTIKDKVFLPFFTTKDINEGTGLGLSVVHGLVTDHHGKIDIQSDRSGTTVAVTFPVERER